MLLEANGYKTSVFEFIATEHTSKNTMIVGVKMSMPRERTCMATDRSSKVGIWN